MANSDGRADMTKIVDVARKMIEETSMPEGMFASLEGTFKAQEEATRTIGILSVISLTLVFALLYSRYRSAMLATIIIGSVPLALIGSVAALWIAGQNLSVASMIGFITLTGIAARNGILKISHIANLAVHENVPWGRELIVRGCLERLTPVLMTALSAGVALVPLLIDPANPGKEILHPVAVTIFGGLLSATFLDAFVTPILMSLFGRGAILRLRQATEAERATPAAAAGPAVTSTF
jgi:HME family heavy-metal exporter